METALTLIANPGSASRKYSLYAGDQLRASLHFEWQNGELVCTIKTPEETSTVFADIPDLSSAPSKVIEVLKYKAALQNDEAISAIGLRIVCPGSFFTLHRRIDEEFETKLASAMNFAPLHVAASLEELRSLKNQFPGTVMVGVSDSAFHSTRPDYALGYSIRLEDTEKFDIKRFGYHGLSMSSVVRKLNDSGRLPPKLVVAHLGSGASISAILNARSIDNTMGFSPLEGLTMSTRSGNIDATAVDALKKGLKLDDAGLQDYLNTKSGLLGIGGSSEIPELIKKEATGDKRSRLALNTYVYNIQKGIAEMTSALGGIDALVFTGTVGERSAPIRQHIASRLHYLDFEIDEAMNASFQPTEEPTIISLPGRSRPIIVVHTDEAYEILQAVRSIPRV